MNMKKITLKISAFLLFALSALQVQGQSCPEIWDQPGVYKIATCGLATELYMTINGSSGELEWAAEIASGNALEPTQLWTIKDHRDLDPNGFVEITADLSSLAAGDWTMVVDDATYAPAGADTDVRITVMNRTPYLSSEGAALYGYDQFQRRRETGWGGPGNNALFCKPPGQGNMRYRDAPAAAGDDVVFSAGGAISPLRLIFVETLSTDEFDTSSVFISNPVKDELSIEGLNQSIKQISVYDLLGKQVITNNPSDDTTSVNLDVSSLTSGLYIVKLEGENGQSFTKKIIKE